MEAIISTILFITQLSFGICDQELQLDYLSQQDYFNTSLAGVVQSDFELVGGLIFVEAELNGVTQKFILDTRSEHLIINSDVPTSRRPIAVMKAVGGSKKIYKAKNIEFDWNGKKANRQLKYSVDLGNITKAKNKEFAGMTGYDQVKKQELFVDYKNKKVFLISKNNKDFFEHHEMVEKIRFRMVGHLPVVKVEIGKKKYYFAIDTGAEVNVIDKKFRGKIPKEMIVLNSTKKIMSGNNNEITVPATTIKSMKVGDSKYENMAFAFSDLSFLTLDGFKIDGLLGYPFLNQAKFSINYKKKNLCKWELKTKYKDSLQVALYKNKVKFTKSLFYRNQNNVLHQD